MSCIFCGERNGWPFRHRTDVRIEAWRIETGDLQPYFWQLCSACGNASPSRSPRQELLDRYWEINREINGGGRSEGAT